MAELKPCPFCGGSAQLVEGVRGSYFIYYIKCDNCQAIGEKFENKCCDRIKAYEAWNTRAIDAKYEKLVSFLKQEIAMRDYVCTTNHAVLLDNAKELLKEIGE